MTRPLVLALHGTRDPRGIAVGSGLRSADAAALPGVEVRLAWVNVASPSVVEAVSPGCVLVPCLLGAGFHVRVDIAAAVRGVSDAVATDPLGPESAILDAVADRVEASGGVSEAMLLGWAGSSDAVSRAQAEEAARELGRRWGRPVLAVAAGGASDAVAQARRAGASEVGIASYLIAPGRFADILASAGADRVSDPIGVHPALVELLVRRYRTA